ncbi:MAG: glycosyltransferase family 4 protein [Rhodospirillaceae bacterium]|nr:glycosyltransferase family 4 protein [Rhodospirillaceae bacterium]MDD9929358.1 glycosyltransferase family 4 protein [Rhodospirillaceae bacterium]
MTAPKILIYSTAKSGTGVAQFAEHIGGALAQTGWQIVIAQPEEPNYAARMGSVAAVERVYFPNDPYEDIVGFGADRYAAAQLLIETRPDLIVISNGVHPIASVAALQAGQFLRVPYVTVDGLVAPSLYDWDENVLRMVSALYQAAAAVIVKSQDNLKMLRHCLRLPETVGSVIVSGRPEIYFEPPNAEARARLRGEIGIPDDAILCLTAAKLEIVKGHTFQLQAMQKLKHRTSWAHLHFAWVGEGEERSALQEEVERGGVSDRVHFIGHRTDIPDWMDAADLCVLTSHSEGIPLSVMEAMAKGLPVVATNVGGTAEAMGDAGILIPRPALTEECISGLTDALDKLALDGEARQTMGEASRARAQQMFRLDRMVSDYRGLFERVLAVAKPS